jgi:hypothetical protein
MWQVTDEADVEWMLARLRPTPFRHFTEPVRLAPVGTDGMERTYIRCAGMPAPPFEQAAAAVQSTPGWRYVQIDTPHVPYITHPNEVTAALVEISASQ